MPSEGVNLVEPIVGAVISWMVPKILDSVLGRSKREGGTAAGANVSFPWVKWSFALALGAGIGGFLSGVIGSLSLQTPGDLGNWTVFGVAIGISQWFVLSRYLGLGPFWAVLSALGWSVWSILQAGGAPPHVGWVIVGLTVGILQWFMLVRVRRRAIWWVPANVVGWLVAGSVGWVLGLGLLQSGFSLTAAWIMGWAAVGVVGSLFWGFALARMPAKQ